MRLNLDLSDIYIKTYPFASIGEIADTTNYKGVRSGDVAWQAIQGAASGDDLGLIAERITVDAVRLDAETVTPFPNTWTSTSVALSPYLTATYRAPGSSAASGEWRWTSARLQPIKHTLYIYGLYISDNDYIDVWLPSYSGTTCTFPAVTYSPFESIPP